MCLSWSLPRSSLPALQQLTVKVQGKLVSLGMMTPKVHYFGHIPLMIERYHAFFFRYIVLIVDRFGMPRYYWCMLTEGFYKKVKANALLVRNNISVAKRAMELHLEREFLEANYPLSEDISSLRGRSAKLDGMLPDSHWIRSVFIYSFVCSFV